MSKSLSVRNAEDKVREVADLLGYSRHAPAVRAALMIVLAMPDDVRSEIMSRLRDDPEFDRPDRIVSSMSVLSVHGQDFMSTTKAVAYLKERLVVFDEQKWYPRRIVRMIQSGRLKGRKIDSQRKKSHYLVLKSSLDEYILEMNRPRVTQE